MKEAKSLARDIDEEVILERLLSKEWISEDGDWKWEILDWERDHGHANDDGNTNVHLLEADEQGGEERRGAVDLDLVVQSHPILGGWIAKVIDVAERLELDITGDGKNKKSKKQKGKEDEDEEKKGKKESLAHLSDTNGNEVKGNGNRVFRG